MSTSLVPFPMLADPLAYRSCLWDLSEPSAQREYWLGLFRRHFPSLLDAYRQEAADRGVDAATISRKANAAAGEFIAYLDQLEESGGTGREAKGGQREDGGKGGKGGAGGLDILTICTVREAALRKAGIADPYRLAKQRDTAHALALLPALLEQLDAMPEPQRWRAVIEGVFAGNIYDLGATETAAMFTDRRVDFLAVRSRLKPRPWRFDDLERWEARVADRERGPHRAAVLFVDNAGPDVTLGMLPLARELLRRGTAVILTANTSPSLNDVTHDELVALVDAVAAFDPLLREALAAGRLTRVPSGNHAPLIDLSRVSPELAAATDAAGVDLVVLEGMGRAIESNFDARLSCDTLKLAMIKDRGVAEGLAAYAPGPRCSTW